MSKTLFTGVQILDCSGDNPFVGELLVEGNRISAIARDGKFLVRDGADVIDGGGTATLMPGLIESHAHLSINNAATLTEIGAIPPEETTLIAMHNAQALPGLRHHQPVSARLPPNRASMSSSATKSTPEESPDRGSSPQPPGSRSPLDWATCAPSIMPDVSSMAIVVDGPENYRVDIVKLVISGDTFVPHALSHTTVMSEAEVAAAAEVVHGTASD